MMGAMAWIGMQGVSTARCADCRRFSEFDGISACVPVLRGDSPIRASYQVFTTVRLSPVSKGCRIMNIGYETEANELVDYCSYSCGTTGG